MKFNRASHPELPSYARWPWGKLDHTFLQLKASRYASLFVDICDAFSTPFPDPLVEKSDIWTYHSALLHRFGHERATDIAAIMAAEWGPDWQEQLFPE